MADEGGKAVSEYRYNRLTWAEMDEAIGLEKVVLPGGRGAAISGLVLSLIYLVVAFRSVLLRT